MDEHRILNEHHLYLLRVWYESGARHPVWRASLVLPRGAPRRHFASRAALLAYLQIALSADEEGALEETCRPEAMDSGRHAGNDTG